MDFSYLRTPQDLYRLKPNSNQAFTNFYGSRRRQLYYNQPYEQYETEKIQHFKIFAQKQGINLECSDQNICRYLHSYQFNFKECLKKITEFLQWEHNPSIQNISPRTKELLIQGIIYTFGRDKMSRPVIYMDLSKINFQNYSLNDYYSAINAVVQVVVNYRFVKGVIETYLWVMDMNGQNFTDLHIEKIKKIVDKLSVVYSMFLGQMLVVNAGRLTKIVYSAARSFICQETQRKIKLLDRSQLKNMKQFIDENELLQIYGGRNPMFQEYWPPRNPQLHISRVSSFTATKIEAKNEIESQYFSIQDNSAFFDEVSLSEELTSRKMMCCPKNDCVIF